MHYTHHITVNRLSKTSSTSAQVLEGLEERPDTPHSTLRSKQLPRLHQLQHRLWMTLCDLETLILCQGPFGADPRHLRTSECITTRSTELLRVHHSQQRFWRTLRQFERSSGHVNYLARIWGIAEHMMATHHGLRNTGHRQFRRGCGRKVLMARAFKGFLQELAM